MARARRITTVLLASAALCLGACGGSEEQAEEEPCVILETGAKLCGDDARAYCARFTAMDPPDVQSAQACRRLGVSIPLTREERIAEEEASQEAQAREQAKRWRTGRPFEPAIKRAMGEQRDQFFAAELVDDTHLLIETDYNEETYGDSLAPRPVRPNPGVLTRICRAVHRLRPDLIVVIHDDGGVPPLRTCFPD